MGRVVARFPNLFGMAAPWAAGAAVQTASRAVEVRGLWRSVLRYTKKVRVAVSAAARRVHDATRGGAARGRPEGDVDARAAAQMPKAQQDYYYSYARQNFVSFADEDDPERINFLIEVRVRAHSRPPLRACPGAGGRRASLTREPASGSAGASTSILSSRSTTLTERAGAPTSTNSKR